MTAQGVNEYVLDGLALGGMLTVHSATALSGAEMDPVPSFVTSAAITGTIHEGLKQQRPVTVKHMPVSWQPARGPRQDHARKSLDLNPGQHKEATLIDDELKMAFPFFSTPSDPGIARRHSPCGAGKLQAGEISPRQLLGLDEIAQMGAEGDAKAKIVVTVDVLFEQGIEIPVRSLDEVKGEGIKISGASRHRGLSVALRRTDHMARPGRSCVTKHRQGEKPLIPQMLEKSPALFILEFAGRAFPFEQFADGFGQFGKTEVGKIPDSLTDECNLGSTEITAGKGKFPIEHGGSPLCFVLPYSRTERMSSEKRMGAQKCRE